MLQNRLFFALASRSGFGATISDAVARSSIVFCNSVSADRIVMAVSRLLHAVAACVILLSFAAGLPKSYWSGCMKAATVICQQIGASDFPSKNPFKKCFKIFFFSLWRRDPVLELQFPTPLRVVLLHAMQLSLRRSHWNGCVKVASCFGCMRNVFCSWISQIVLDWLHEGCEMDLLADFLHFGTSVFFVARRFRAVGSVGRKECSVKCEV